MPTLCTTGKLDWCNARSVCSFVETVLMLKSGTVEPVLLTSLREPDATQNRMTAITGIIIMDDRAIIQPTAADRKNRSFTM